MTGFPWEKPLKCTNYLIRFILNGFFFEGAFYQQTVNNYQY
mgnify:CR=1 FL=1